VVPMWVIWIENSVFWLTDSVSRSKASCEYCSLYIVKMIALVMACVANWNMLLFLDSVPQHALP
jgi:hypothetical protein